MRRLLIEWNLILLNGDADDFFGCSVLAFVFERDGDGVVAVVNAMDVDAVADIVCGWQIWTIGDDELFIKDGGVVLNGNQSR